MQARCRRARLRAGLDYGLARLGAPCVWPGASLCFDRAFGRL